MQCPTHNAPTPYTHNAQRTQRNAQRATRHNISLCNPPYMYLSLPTLARSHTKEPLVTLDEGLLIGLSVCVIYSLVPLHAVILTYNYFPFFASLSRSIPYFHKVYFAPCITMYYVPQQLAYTFPIFGDFCNIPSLYGFCIGR